MLPNMFQEKSAEESTAVDLQVSLLVSLLAYKAAVAHSVGQITSQNYPRAGVRG